MAGHTGNRITLTWTFGLCLILVCAGCDPAEFDHLGSDARGARGDSSQAPEDADIGEPEISARGGARDADVEDCTPDAASAADAAASAGLEQETSEEDSMRAVSCPASEQEAHMTTPAKPDGQSGPVEDTNRCDAEGAVRCQGSGATRQTCSDGRWVAAAPCVQDSSCVDGRCVSQAEACRGKASLRFCEGSGLMLTCSDAGLLESTLPCESQRHCELGLASGMCAACLPGEFRCRGDNLEMCGAQGEGFAQQETCALGTCDATAGTCSRNACVEDGPADTVNCTGRCASSGRCVECLADGDCSAGVAECAEAFCNTTDGICERRALPAGRTCGTGYYCDGAARCVECTAAPQCGDHATCVASTCQCDPGYVSNPQGRGCNFDECASPQDNRCGGSAATGNVCMNTVEGYACSCGPGWTMGVGQCYQGGTSSDVVTVPNGSSWNVVPEFGIVCPNAFDSSIECAKGQLTWLNVCGLPDADPQRCASLAAATTDTEGVQLQRIAYSGPLQDIVVSAVPLVDNLPLVAVGDTIVVHVRSARYVMRIMSMNAEVMSYEWALVL